MTRAIAHHEPAAAFQFLVHRPARPLSRYIDALWLARGRIDYARDHILPTTSAVAIINLGAPHQTIDKRDDAIRETHRTSWVCGVQREYIINQPVAETYMVGVAFKPHGAYPFLRASLSDLTDRITAMDGLWGRRVATLRDRLHDAPTPQAKFAVLEGALLQRLDPAARGLDRIGRAIELLTRPGIVPVRAVSDALDISHKHLISEFKRVVGVTPKMFLRIHKFGCLLGSLDVRAPIDWAGLAHAHGWSDQAHLINDFKKFSGCTPTEYARRRRQVFGPDIEPGDNAEFIPIA